MELLHIFYLYYQNWFLHICRLTSLSEARQGMGEFGIGRVVWARVLLFTIQNGNGKEAEPLEEEEKQRLTCWAMVIV